MRLLALLTAVASLAAFELAGAAFVDSTPTAAPMSADTVTRWLGVEAPGAGTCTAPADSVATGSDATAAVSVGGRAAGAAGRTLDCALVVRARDTFPEGAATVTVRVAASGAPLLGAALTPLDGSAAAETVTLQPGERRAVRLRVKDAAEARATLAIEVGPAQEPAGFLRYDVPVDVCEGVLSGSCKTPVDPTPNNPGTPGTPGGGQGETPGGAPTPPNRPVTAPDENRAQSQSPGCTARAPFTFTLPQPKGQRIVSATLTIGGQRVAVRRSKGRFTARVDLRGATSPTVRAAIALRTARGRTIRSTQTLSVCAPKPQACTSRRSITIRLPRVRGQRVVSASVTVQRRRVAVRRRAGRFSAVVDLRRYPKQTVRVAIAQRTASGRTVRSTRTYRTCAPRKGSRP